MPRRSEYISASTVASGTRSIIGVLKCNFVPEVVRARLVGRGRLVLLRLRLDAQREELAAVLRGAHPTREPIFGALDVQRAVVVAVLVVARGPCHRCETTRPGSYCRIPLPSLP